MLGDDLPQKFQRAATKKSQANLGTEKDSLKLDLLLLRR